MVGSDTIYWVRKEVFDFKGIVVLFAWISIHEKKLKNYVDLYASLGWSSLVCHAHFLNAFYPEKAMSLAFAVLSELIEELRIRPCSVVFGAFSGGTIACMYKVLQGKYRLVRNCIYGNIYDSSPVDFTSDLGIQYVLHPTIQKMPGSSKLVSWVAKGIVSGLDALYLTRFESQRIEYWQALYSYVVTMKTIPQYTKRLFLAFLRRQHSFFPKECNDLKMKEFSWKAHMIKCQS